MNKTKLFSALLGKHSEEKFFKEFWGSKWLHIKAEDFESDYFPFSINDLNTFFTNSRLSYPWIRAVMDGKELPLELYRNTKISPLTDFVDNDKLFELLSDGATIVINSIDKRNSKIGIYCRELEKELGVKVWANIYIAPPGSVSFPMHQDPHEVFVVQLKGAKNWKIPENDSIQNTTSDKHSTPPVVEFQIQEGDVLYVPKSYPHVAFGSENTPSIHITLGIEGLTWSDLIVQFAKEAAKDVDFQQRIPLPIEDKEVHEKFINSFQKKWLEFSQNKNPTDLLNKMYSADYYQNGTQKQNRLSDWLGTPEINVDTILQKRVYVAHQIKNQGKMILLSFNNKELVFPRFIAPLLEKLTQEKPYTLSEIVVEQSDQEKIDFTKKLVLEGLLTILG